MQSEVTDETIARYLSGKATPEEVTDVLDYFSESDDRLDGLLAMSAAVEENEKATKRKTRPLWPIISVAASVALIVGLAIAMWLNGQSGSVSNIDPAPAYAEQTTVADTL